MNIKIICPKCKSNEIDEKSYEANVGARNPFKPLLQSEVLKPRYRCRKCGQEFHKGAAKRQVDPKARKDRRSHV